MIEDKVYIHDCLILLLVVVISIIGIGIISFGEINLNNKSKILCTIIGGCIGLVIVLLLILYFKDLWYENKNEYFVVNETNINQQEFINSQKRIAFDKDIMYVPARYFSGNTKLEIIEFFVDDDSFLVIDDFAFFSCSELKCVRIHGGSTLIKSNAFANCKRLKEVSFETDITIIHQNTFASCESLKEITIPKSVTKIEKGAFCGCSNLNKVYFEDETSKWYSTEKSDFTKGKLEKLGNPEENAKLLCKNSYFYK